MYSMTITIYEPSVLQLNNQRKYRQKPSQTNRPANNRTEQSLAMTMYQFYLSTACCYCGSLSLSHNLCNMTMVREVEWS
jgi:hypothetical protein